MSKMSITTPSCKNLERRKQTKTTADVSGDKCAGAPTDFNITKKEAPAADRLFVLGSSVRLKQTLLCCNNVLFCSGDVLFLKGMGSYERQAGVTGGFARSGY